MEVRITDAAEHDLFCEIAGEIRISSGVRPHSAVSAFSPPCRNSGVGRSLFCFCPIPYPPGGASGLVVLGVWASHQYSLREGKTDPGEVIIDEVAGTWIAMYGLPSGFSPRAFPLQIFDILNLFR